VILLSVAFLVPSLGGSIGIWSVRTPVTTRATRVFDRVDAGLGACERGIGQANASLRKAMKNVEAIRDGHARLGRDTGENRVALRLIATQIEHGLAPQVEDTRQRLLAVAEAAIAVNSVLGDLNEFPSVSVSGPDAERVKQTQSKLTELAALAEQLYGMVKGPKAAEGEDHAALGSRVTNIDQLLKAIQAMAAQIEQKVVAARQEVTEIRSRTLAAIDPATVIGSLVLLWIAISQLGMAAHGWAWLKKERGGPAPASQENGRREGPAAP
jgi:hypothetical protein